MTQQGFSYRCAGTLRWLAPVAAIVLAAAFGLVFAVVLTARGAVAQEVVRPIPAPALVACRGGNRAARRVTCVVDGDTFWRDGVKYRLACIDAAELAEGDGTAARALLSRLLADPALRVLPTGSTGRWDRPLARVITTAGDVERVLVAAGLARRVDYRSTRDVCRRAGW